AADEHFAKAWLVHQRRFPRGRRPLRRIDLLDVVHEIKTNASGRTSIERCEDTGLAIGRHAFDLLKARVAKKLHGQFAAFGHAAIFGSDGWLMNPLLEPLYRLSMSLLDLGANVIQFGLLRGPGAWCATESGSACGGAF